MSRERRFFVSELRPRGMTLEAAEAHHLIHVLRLSEGDRVAVFDGQGRAAEARISRIAEDRVELELGDPLPSRESPLELTLGVAVPKGNKMSWIVQKLTELGAVAIHPLVTERSDVDRTFVTKRLERWRRIALEAAKQCGRSRVPEIAEPASFDALAQPGALVLTPGAPALPANVVPGPLLIGPEGGWSEAELTAARERSLERFGLGPRTLRTETAAVTAAALLQWLAGDLGG